MVMSGFFRRRLQLQLLLILLAAVSVAALSVLLISDSIRNAEQAVIADMGKQLSAALLEMGQQYSDRITSDSTWSGLPAPRTTIQPPRQMFPRQSGRSSKRWRAGQCRIAKRSNCFVGAMSWYSFRRLQCHNGEASLGRCSAARANQPAVAQEHYLWRLSSPHS
jgi:hypothetical protein